MSFHDLLQQNNIYFDNEARSKTAVLLKVSQLICQQDTSLEVATLFDAYWKRESMGSTTIGHGIMIPHLRWEKINTNYACVIKLMHPVDFGAEDKQPVDIVIGLLVAAQHINTHLHLLADIMRPFNNPEFRIACRQTVNREELFALFKEQEMA